MQKIILSFIMIIGLTLNILASSQMESKIKKSVKPISHKKIKRMDTSHTKRKAIRRNFKTQKEFHHKAKRNKKNRNIAQKRMHTKQHKNSRYANAYNYQVKDYRDDYHSNSQRGYRHPNQGWLLAFRYDRASFYDREGFYYGFFNRHGYYFEDIFYSYDRNYTFRDRVRGRGLFDHRYYMPANAKYYGFCSPRDHRRSHTRVY